MKSVYCKSGLNGKDLYNEIPETLSFFFFYLRNCGGQDYESADAVSCHVDGISALILTKYS